MKEKKVLFEIKESTKEKGYSQEAKELGKKTESLWNRTEQEVIPNKACSELPESVEVAVVGGGMAGMLIGYELTKRGLDAIVLEKDEVGEGSTAHTTAKITSLHGGIYSKLVSSVGEEAAKLYYESQEAAIESFQRIVNNYEIACEFERKSHILYAQHEKVQIEREYECIKKLGIPASYITNAPLPFPIQGGVVFTNQAQFHPLKFLNELAKHVKVYTHSKVTRIDSDGILEVNHKHCIRAKDIVIATHYPIINSKGFFFAKLDQERSYVVALEQPGKFDLHDMYIDLDKKGHSFRTYDKNLIVGLGNHRTGDCKAEEYYKELEGEVTTWYPKVKIIARWSNQDCMSLDSIPYIGRYSKSLEHIYVASGFGQWGMSNSMVSAEVIADLITTGESRYEKLYSPSRFVASGTGKLIANAGVSVLHLTKELLQTSSKEIKEIGQGEAGVVKFQGKSIGVYRDLEDQMYVVDTKCPHLGCQLQWNKNDKTWDCPCHGSRFDIDGHLLMEPAQKDLTRCHIMNYEKMAQEK